MVNKIESGARKVSALELLDLAGALDTQMASFFREPTPALVAHRIRQDHDSVDSSIDRLMAGLAADVEFLETLGADRFGLAAAAAKLDAVDLRIPGSMADADSLASAARRLLELGPEAPAHDLAGLVGNVGLLAFSSDLGPDAADAATILLRRGAVSVVNSHSKLGRRRLALAHELAHYLVQDQYTVDWRVSDSAHEDLEARFDRFARALLLPERGVRSAWEKHGRGDLRTAAVTLGSEYRVDMSTLARRLSELELVDPDEAAVIRRSRTTKADFVELGLWMEPELEGETLPLPYQRAVIAAVREEQISRERALDLLRGTFADDDLPPVRLRHENELWNFVS